MKAGTHRHPIICDTAVSRRPDRTAEGPRPSSATPALDLRYARSGGEVRKFSRLSGGFSTLRLSDLNRTPPEPALCQHAVTVPGRCTLDAADSVETVKCQNPKCSVHFDLCAEPPPAGPYRRVGTVAKAQNEIEARTAELSDRPRLLHRCRGRSLSVLSPPRIIIPRSRAVADIESADHSLRTTGGPGM